LIRQIEIQDKETGISGVHAWAAQNISISGVLGIGVATHFRWLHISGVLGIGVATHSGVLNISGVATYFSGPEYM
jgi:hypothetical protein